MHRGLFPDPLTYRYPEWYAFGEFLYSAKDIVDFGTPLSPESAREAYRKGIFPWYTEGLPLPWHCPRRRAVLDFEDLRVARSLERERRRTQLTFTIDTDFPGVIRACALAYRPGQGGTWITEDFERVYTTLHDEGVAHSVEAREDGQLVGGLYGVDAGGVFCGESMFYERPNASKLALLFLIDHLRQRGAAWLDCQVMTPHMKALGAREITRDAFLQRLAHTQRLGLRLFC